MTPNNMEDDNKIPDRKVQDTVKLPKKKKKRRRTPDKAKIAENKKKAKAKKLRQKEQLKEERARQRAMKRQEKAAKRQDRDQKQQEKMPDASASVKVQESLLVDNAGAAENFVGTEEMRVEEVRAEEIHDEETCVAERTADQDKKPKKTKETKGHRRLLGIAGIAAAVLLAAGTGAFFCIRQYLTRLRIADEAVEAMVHTEAVELAEYSLLQHRKDHVKEQAGKDIPQSLVDAARFVIDGVRNRPPEVELTAENAADFAKIESCVINTQTGKVDVTMSAEGLAVSDDGYYYLFEEKAYENELTGEAYIIEDQKDVDLTFSVNLNYNSANSRLFSKFVVAVKKDGKFMAISRP